jgi:SAM-dependent methyltransferase
MTPFRVWSGRPNLALTEQVVALTPGTALEVGCGEGADAIWLAAQGWQVTGVDFSAQALHRAAAHTPAQVAPGGSLMIVGHHPSDMNTSIPRPPEPDLYYTAEDLAADLPQHAWIIHTRLARPRKDAAPTGEAVTIHDTVLRAQRRR